VPSISLSNLAYGPSQFFIRQGGNMRFDFKANFSAAPPSTFNYTVRLKDASGATAKTMSGSQATGGQTAVPVSVIASPTRDAGGNLDYGGYRVEFEISAPGYDTLQESRCTGICICEEPPCDCLTQQATSSPGQGGPPCPGIAQ
jgi:hypothetical protein